MDINLIISVGTNVILLAYFFGKLRGEITALKNMVDFRLDRVERKVEETNHVKERLSHQEEKNSSAHKRIDELRSDVEGLKAKI